VSLERLREWYADHPGHRGRGGKAARHRRLTSFRLNTWDLARGRAARRHVTTKHGPCGDSCVLDELHAEALEDREIYDRPRFRKEPDYGAEMKLSEGKTCGDCWHLKRCRALGFTSSDANTRCDFHPRRFVDAGFPDDGWRQAAVSAIRERFAA
jgi:hypothetical protein